jgi:hypothetical protein
VLLIILSDESETKDGLTCIEENKYKMLVVTDHNIQEFK